MEEDKLKEYTNLGYVNSWELRPEELDLCNLLEHKRSEIKENEQRTLTTVVCDKCKIFYRYSSEG